MDDHQGDPYRTCETGRCNHDLAHAVGIAELWAADGPFRSTGVVLTMTRSEAPVLFDDDEAPASQQRWAV